MLTAIVHALFNSSMAAAFSYLLFHWFDRNRVFAVLPSKVVLNPIRKSLAAQWTS